jgi:predicted ATP-grasp superfamily ATP-dependent carboligase
MAELIGVTRQLIGEPWLNSHGFQYAGSIGPHPISDAAHEALVRIGNVLAVEFDLVGLFGVDFMLDGDDVWTLEVNPRYTASVEVVERFSGLRAIELHAKACGHATTERAGSSPTPIIRAARVSQMKLGLGGGDAPTRCWGKAILFALRDLLLTERLAKMALAESARKPWPTLADISPARTLVDEGRPVLTMFAEGENVIEVEAKLRKRSIEISSLLFD